jgi:hypothetical protein
VRPATALLTAVIAACSGDRPAPSAAAGTPAAAPDSLVLTIGRYQVWLSDARPGRDSSGVPCVERSVEIRTDSSRVRVPLLYVMAPPRLLDRETVLADLVLDCRPIASYRVALATGRPTKVADR